MPSQGGALQAIGLNLPQIFINRTHSLAGKLLRLRCQAIHFPLFAGL